MTSPFGFQRLAQDGTARRGRLTTAHGTVETPAFMPVGTAATVKGVLPEQLEATGSQMVLANTYHLMLRPGAERIEALGGLHRFMKWPGPILTDSGGFQVMSLDGLRTLSEEGVAFRSHLDGARVMLTPERAIDIQRQLDADVSMQLDECLRLPAERSEIRRAMELSLRWAERCRHAFEARPGYGLFGIVQGGTEPDLRHESARRLVEIGFEGYAIGGLAVGEPQETMLEIAALSAQALPADKPRYLMGVGRPMDLVEAVRRGVDMFDCVIPTRSGRTAKAFTWSGELNLRNARHKDDPGPLDPDLTYPPLDGISRAYLHHLFRAGEMLGPILLTLHNLHFFQDLMSRLRLAIEEKRFQTFAADFSRRQGGGAAEAA